MEKLIYWIKRILHKKWKECRSFCGVCKYYSDCSGEEDNKIKMDIKKKGVYYEPQKKAPLSK